MTKGLDDRSRDENGRIRKKRDDTHAGTIEKTYKIDLDTRSDTKLRTVLKKNNVDDLSQLLKNVKGNS
jgi:hypothetical protein